MFDLAEHLVKAALHVQRRPYDAELSASLVYVPNVFRTSYDCERLDIFCGAEFNYDNKNMI